MEVARVVPIFPEGVYLNTLKRKLTKKEISFAKYQKTVKNAGNIYSEDNYILNKPPFKKLKKEITEFVEDYFKLIISTKDKIKPYVTQSWLNYTSDNEYHHQHFHPNSFLSGVFYFDAIEGVDCIRFHKTKYQTIVPDIDQFNVYNCEFFTFNIKSKEVIIFPSSLTHSVPNKKNKNTRISLAFNTFITGTVSANDLQLKQLVIPSK
tara:strand:+ start:2296 stop:2916 length:621 start_codon:yes stop_codon:yes gene_type:complete